MFQFSDNRNYYKNDPDLESKIIRFYGGRNFNYFTHFVAGSQRLGMVQLLMLVRSGTCFKALDVVTSMPPLAV